MKLCATVRDERFTFADLREVFAKANEEKSGDRLAGLAASSERERVAAKRVLADLTLAEIVDNPLIDPDEDEVSRLILDTHDRAGVRGDRRPDAWASSASTCSTTAWARPRSRGCTGASRPRSRRRSPS